MTSSPATGPIDMKDVMQILPHRYPFLLIDRVLVCIPGQQIVGVKSVGTRDTNGYGDGMPHLLVVEALAQLSVVLAYKSLPVQPTGNDLMFFAGIDDAHFGSVARRGDRLTLRSSLGRIKRLVGRFQAEAFVDDRRVVSVTMLAAIRPAAEPPGGAPAAAETLP